MPITTVLCAYIAPGELSGEDGSPSNKKNMLHTRKFI